MPDQGQISPFYFTAQRDLFGVLHAPAITAVPRCGVVLCNPLGHEYVRSHRACQHLASRLASAGHAVLRFDYFGTGDSRGDDLDGRLARWITDVTSAVRCLRERSRSRRVCLVGLRFGGSLAALAGGQLKPDMVVLWQPVVTGKAYLSEMVALHRSLEDQTGRKPGGADRSHAENNGTEILGFRYPAALFDDIERLDLTRLEQTPGERVLLLESSGDATQMRLQQRLEDLCASVDHRHIPEPQVWTEEPYKAVMPLKGIMAIASWL